MQVDIKKYFTNLTPKQISQFESMGSIYSQMNKKINLISRSDIGNLYEHHILHSLAIAKVITFSSGQSILDIGSGGGFPGIPLAIMFPETSFMLVDSIGKKIRAVEEIANQLNLTNVVTKHSRVEDVSMTFDWAVCRAVGRLDVVWSWVKPMLKSNSSGLSNGLFYLKGSNYLDEMPHDIALQEWSVSKLLPDKDYFEQKSLLLLSLKRDN